MSLSSVLQNCNLTHFQIWNTAVNWNIERGVAQYERTYRGRELPGFINYKTFEGMVKEQIKQLEEPAVLKLKEVAGTSYHDATTIAAWICTTSESLLTLCPILYCFVVEIVKKELFKVAQSSFVGFPHLIRTTKVSFIHLPLRLHAHESALMNIYWHVNKCLSFRWRLKPSKSRRRL